MKFTGAYFCNDKCASCVKRNTGQKEFKPLRDLWGKRNLNIVGKICIIKTFLISQLVYIMQALVIPDHVLTDINRLLFRFLRRKEKERKKKREKKRDCNRKAFGKSEENSSV